MQVAVLDGTNGQPIQQHQLFFGNGLPVERTLVTLAPNPVTGIMEPALVLFVDPAAAIEPLPYIPNEAFR